MATTLVPASQRSARLTTVATKIVMAASGLFFILFVLMHMYGNLKAFGGAESYNTYAHHLRTLGEPILPYSGFLWLFRLALLGSLLLHVTSAIKLWKRANSARSSKYVVKKRTAATISSKWMRWGGVTLLLFIIFHLLQFTTNTIQVNGNWPDPYHRMVAGFQAVWTVPLYLLALAALGMHLRHGTWSALQTLGLTQTAKSERTAKAVALLVALVVAVGFALVPLAIVAGIIK